MKTKNIRYWTKAALIKAARTRYGDGWQTPLARDLKIDPRTVRRWASDNGNVPIYVKLWFESGNEGA